MHLEAMIMCKSSFELGKCDDDKNHDFGEAFKNAFDCVSTYRDFGFHKGMRYLMAFPYHSS